MRLKIKVKRWPSPYRFAFGITDDPDFSTLDRVRLVYDFCEANGVYPTRGTWVLDPRRTCGIVNQDPPNKGITLEDETYARYCKDLQDRGFEIALHGVSSGDNKREDVIEGIEKYTEMFGHPPRTIFYHSHNAEHLYWGSSFTKSTMARLLVRMLVPHKPEVYFGHDPDSEYFCGDISLNTFDYTRMFRTVKLNTIAQNPNMPYHLYDKPFVRRWFSTTAEDLDACSLINERSLDRIATKDGLILIYAHLAEKFVTDEGALHPVARRSLTLVGGRGDCWKTGAGEILDRCLAHKNLIVAHRREGVVISNPTHIEMRKVQIQSDAPTLFVQPGLALEKNRHGAFVIETLRPMSTITLYKASEQARIGDPQGIGRLEVLGMQFQEIKRLLLLRRLKQLKQKLTPRTSRSDKGSSSDR